MHKNKNTKVFIFTSVHIWNDTRIFYKQARSLAKIYNVELHAPADFMFKKIDEVKIYGLPLWNTVKDRNNIRKELWKRIKKSKADIYHFHDPELIWIGIKIRYLKRKKVIYDIHENYPGAILDKEWIPEGFRLLTSLVFDITERITTIFYDHIIYVTEIVGNRFKHIKKSTCIYNYPLSNHPIINTNKIPGQIIYVGNITRIRGIVELLQSLKIINEKYFSKWTLLLVGQFQYKLFENKIIELIDDYHLSNNVQLLGPVKYEEIFKYIASSVIGIATYLPYKNNISGIPNKILEYMSMKTAVVCSNFILYRKIIKESQAGILVNPLSPENIANGINYLLTNNELTIEMGIHGFNSVRNLYRWEIEEKKLYSIYNNLINNR